MRKIYAICLAAAMLFFTSSFSQSFDTYLKIDGIPGSSTKVGHLNEIDVFSYSSGLASCPQNSANGANACKPSISELNMMTKMDKALNPLKMALLQGQVIAYADLVMERPNGSGHPFIFFRMRLEQVTIASVQESGSSGGDAQPTVSLSLGYGKVAWEYIEQKPDGSAGVKNSGGWDLKANRPWTYFAVN